MSNLPPPPATGRPVTMAKWEYQVVTFDMAEKWSAKRQREEVARFQQRLNEFGADGWEMISYEGVQMYGAFSSKLKGVAYLLFLKRPAG